MAPGSSPRRARDRASRGARPAGRRRHRRAGARRPVAAAGVPRAGSAPAGSLHRHRAGCRPPPGRRSVRHRASRRRDGPCSRSRSRRAAAHPRRHAPRGTRAAATDACSGSGRRRPRGRPDRRSACSRRGRRHRGRRGSRRGSVAARLASSPSTGAGISAVSIPCSTAQSRAGQGRSAKTRTIPPPSSPRTAADARPRPVRPRRRKRRRRSDPVPILRCRARQGTLAYATSKAGPTTSARIDERTDASRLRRPGAEPSASIAATAGARPAARSTTIIPAHR